MRRLGENQAKVNPVRRRTLVAGVPAGRPGRGRAPAPEWAIGDGGATKPADGRPATSPAARGSGGALGRPGTDEARPQPHAARPQLQRGCRRPPRCASASASRARASASRARASASRTAARPRGSPAPTPPRPPARARAPRAPRRDPASLERHLAPGPLGLVFSDPAPVHLDAAQGRRSPRREGSTARTRCHASRDWVRRSRSAAQRASAAQPAASPGASARRARGTPRVERLSTHLSTRAMGKVTRPGPVSMTTASCVLSTITPLTCPPLRRRTSSERRAAAQAGRQSRSPFAGSARHGPRPNYAPTPTAARSIPVGPARKSLRAAARDLARPLDASAVTAVEGSRDGLAWPHRSESPGPPMPSRETVATVLGACGIAFPALLAAGGAAARPGGPWQGVPGAAPAAAILAAAVALAWPPAARIARGVRRPPAPRRAAAGGGAPGGRAGPLRSAAVRAGRWPASRSWSRARGGGPTESSSCRWSSPSSSRWPGACTRGSGRRETSRTT